MSSIFGGGGSSDRRRAKRKGNDAVFTGGNFSGSGGLGGGFSFANNQANVNTDLGPLQGLFDQLLSTSQTGLNQAQGNMNPQLQALFSQLGGIGGQSTAGDFEGLGDIFQSSLSTAQADPFALGDTVSTKLRQLAERKNQRLVNNTFDRLKASGKLGTTGGAGIAGELEQNLFDQGLQFDLAGLDAGRNLQQDAFGRVLGSSQAREGIAGRQFQEAFQRILGQSGMFLQNQAQGANIGFGAGQLANQTSQIPLAFLSALLGAGSTSSNSLLGSAGVDQNNAQMALQESGQMFDFLGNLTGGLLQPGGLLNQES